jgi:hypothetical protein
MPGYFDDDTLRQIAEAHAQISSKAQELVLAFVGRRYISDRAREYAHHGVARRISLLARSIDQIYERLPPNFGGIPKRDTLLDTTIFLQAFLFNAFGILDNLALMWVNERGIINSNGRDLPPSKIGLTKDPKHAIVRASLPACLQSYLDGLGRWLAYLESYRHSLGHRVPLYIPPYAIGSGRRAEYEALDNVMNDALRRGDLAGYERLESKQIALAKFQPVMKHSFEDPTPPIAFHAQILADFATIEEVCQKILRAL